MELKEAIEKARSVCKDQDCEIMPSEIEAIELLIEKAEAFDQAWSCYQDLGRIWDNSTARIEKLERRAKRNIKNTEPHQDIAVSEKIAYHKGIVDALKELDDEEGN